jgi:hypothetical protein
MYKLRDVAQNFEFYGPPHPEDPRGEFIYFHKFYFYILKKVQLFGHVHILIVVDQINGSLVLFHLLLISILDIQNIDIYKPCVI